MPTAGRIFNPLDVPGIVRRNHRETIFPSSSTFVTAETLFMAVDDVPMRAGKLYRFTASMLNIVPSVVNDVGIVRFRYSESGPVTVTGTLLGQFRMGQSSTTQTNTGTLIAFYTPATDITTFSLGLTLARAAAGSGSTGVRLWGSSGEPVDLVIEQCGDDPGASGRIV